MTRRDFLTTVAGAACVTAFVPRITGAQDQQFIRALEAAAKERPAKLTSSARIAPPEEPGTGLIIHGRLFTADGRTPVPAAMMFAHHTDREGLYHRPGMESQPWRLRGWAQTDAEGGFEFQTIRPGAYPSRNIPAHVHFNIFTGSERFHGGELQFDDDPILSAADRSRSQKQGQFGQVRAVRREGSVEHVDVAIKLDPGQRF